MNPCELFRRHVGVFVDGELDPASQLELEQHTSSCANCREHLAFEHAYRVHLRDALTTPPAPASLHARIRLELDREPEQRKRSYVPVARRLSVPLASAAAVVLVVGVVGQRSEPASERAGLADLEDIVALHSIRLPADVAVQPKEPQPPMQTVSSFFRGKVSFPVRPAEFDSRDVRLVGARLSNVRARRAAALYYETLAGQRLTVVVTDADVEDEAVQPLRFGDRSLFYRDVRGYPVPVRREAGLTYAFTGDVDRDTLVRLAAQARVTY